MTGPLGSALTQMRAGFHLARAIRKGVPPPTLFPALIQSRLQQREAHLLAMLEKNVFQEPRSPYRPLFDLAGYDWPRTQQFIRTEGVDQGLRRLAAAGVWLDVREFKGMRPTVRGPHSFSFREDDFINHSAVAAVHTQSSASRSHGTRSNVSIEDLRVHAGYRQWVESLVGVDRHPVVLWLTPGAGFFMTMLYALLGRPPRRWFSQAPAGGSRTQLLAAVTRLMSGAPVRNLEHYPPETTPKVARWIAAANGRGMVMDTFPSTALRLATVAEAGKLGPFTFFAGGEPITPAKRAQVEALGYRLFPFYVFSEFGFVGYACLRPAQTDEVHLLSDIICAIHHPATVDAAGTTVQAYHFTTLLPSARRIMVNVNMGDYGALADRQCGCPLQEAGLRTHLWDIRSFEKLTAEGITYIGPSIISAVEEVLPRTFGGEATDYQLVEAEDGHGYTRLYLFVHPRLGPLDEDRLRAVTMRALALHHLNPGYGAQVIALWADAGTLRVVRRPPIHTVTGKVHHLHRLKTPFREESLV